MMAVSFDVKNKKKKNKKTQDDGSNADVDV